MISGEDWQDQRRGLARLVARISKIGGGTGDTKGVIDSKFRGEISGEIGGEIRRRWQCEAERVNEQDWQRGKEAEMSDWKDQRRGREA